MTTSRQPYTPEQRRAALQPMIASYVRLGYEVVSQTETDAFLIKRKRFSFGWGCFWLFFGILLLWIPLFIYLIYYWSKGDERVYLIVDEWGNVGRNRPPAPVLAAAPREPSPSTIIPGFADSLVIGVAVVALLLAMLGMVFLAVYLFGGPV